jgi:diguanylate cyclase (GGDEF)-like protein/PAS domain S-box-containing protein
VSAASVAVFAQSTYPVAYLPAVACMLAASRLGPLGAAAAVAIIALVGSVAIALNIGPLHLVPGGASAVVYYFQAYLLVMTLASLPLASSMLRREETLAQFQRANELLELAEKEANLGHWHVNLRENTARWSREMFLIHGMDPDAGQPSMSAALDMTLAEDCERARRIVEESISEGKPYRMIARIVRVDGMIRSIESYGKPEFDRAGDVIGMFGTFQDVTDRIEALKALKEAKRAAEREAAATRQLAETDELTGMANRRKILAVLSSAIGTCEECGEDLAVGILDIDHFKMINDTFGHATGDIVLRKIAKIAKLNMQVSDVIGRLGGEEFLIIMPGASNEAAHEKLERLRVAIEQSDWSETEGMPVTGSFGVASMTEGADETWLLQAADNALYEAKRSGRNCLRAAA